MLSNKSVSAELSCGTSDVFWLLKISQLFLIMAASVDYVTTKNGMAQVSPHIPVWKGRDKADSPEDFKSSARLRSL